MANDKNKNLNTIIIACGTISDEINLAARETGCEYPILWIDSGLHNNPDTLKNRLQKEIDQLVNYEQIIVAFGYCGNSILGLSSPECRMVIPRADDCISLMLGSCKKRNEISNETGTYYLTKGWWEYENNIWVDYKNTVKRLGREEADEVYDMLLKDYNRLAVIDTGAYNVNEFLEKAELAAKDLKMELKMIPGNLRFIKKLLTGPWDEEFIIIEPGEAVNLEHIYGDIK